MAKNRQRYNWFNVQNQNRDLWNAVCPDGEFRIVQKEALSGLLPNELLSTYHNIFLMASGTGSGAVYYMMNGNRVDFKDIAIDQMPFGLAFVGDSPTASGVLIQHGDWENRTIYPPDEFWEQINASGIENSFPLSELPEETEGKITNLKIKSQDEAFKNLVNILKDQVGDE